MPDDNYTSPLKTGSMQGPRYATFEKLKTAYKVSELVGKK